ncbi:hypothetical protein [Catenulispora sp. MAP5-51]|uniref:MmyB family transcriptional regulator n=1 Tax=Catenulispora sp. MAP5-51 TaxID=3156298 RepID=UPI003516B1D7
MDLSQPATSHSHATWAACTTTTCGAPITEHNARHIDEPEWEANIVHLSATSPEFAEFWSPLEVAEPGLRARRVLHPHLGIVNLWSRNRTSPSAQKAASTFARRAILRRGRCWRGRGRAEAGGGQLEVPLNPGLHSQPST